MADFTAKDVQCTWDVLTGKQVGRLIGPRGSLGRVAFSPDGRRIVSGGADNTLRQWDVDTGQPIGEPMQARDLMRPGNFVGLEQEASSMRAARCTSTSMTGSSSTGGWRPPGGRTRSRGCANRSPHANSHRR